MNCINPKMKQQVNLYQLDLLTEEQKIVVEAHLLSCEACFEEFYRLSPVIDLLENVPEKFLTALQPRKSVVARIFAFLITAGKMIFKMLKNILGKPTAKILIPATAAVLLALILFLPGSRQYSDLVIIQKAPYISFKESVSDTLVNRFDLFKQGMIFYQQENYPETIRLLRDFLQAEPKNADGNFYLGVCLLLTNDSKTGIEKLKLAATLSQQVQLPYLEERCYWYLGNGFLKLNDVKQAVEYFDRVLAMRLNFMDEARKQIDLIEQRR